MLEFYSLTQGDKPNGKEFEQPTSITDNVLGKKIYTKRKLSYLNEWGVVSGT